MKIFDNPNYNFIRWRWHALALSAMVVIAGAALIIARGMPHGIDLTGGRMLIVQFAEDVPVEGVREAVAPIPGDAVVLRYDDPSTRQVMVRLPLAEAMAPGPSLERQSRHVLGALFSAALPASTEIQRDAVGPSIGADLQRKGI